MESKQRETVKGKKGNKTKNKKAIANDGILKINIYRVR